MCKIKIFCFCFFPIHKGRAWFPWHKLYYKFALSQCKRRAYQYNAPYLSHSNQIDTDFITTPFSFIYNINIMISIIFNTMGTYAWTKIILLYCSLSLHFMTSFWSALFCVTVLDWTSIIFSFCSSNFSSNLFTILIWNAPKRFYRDSLVTSGFLKLSK